MRKYLLALSLLFFYSIGFSQNYLISTYNGQTVSTCAGNFYDSGGSTGNYSDNENLSMTFSSNNTTTTHIRLYFNYLDIDPSDTIYVYDGPNTTSPLIGWYNNTNALVQFPVVASIMNPSGALTVRFVSDTAATGSGWEVFISCAKACQVVNAALDSLATTPHPDDSLYIDLCLGDTVTFVGSALFPQNNYVYNQSVNSCTYIWDFGDGTTATGQTINHYYNFVRGYNVTLDVFDTLGCQSMNFLRIRVRVSNDPIGHISSLPDICSGTDLNVTVGNSSINSISVITPSYYQSASLSFDTATFIPDGGGMGGPGFACYDTYVTFTCFNPGQNVTAASDIISVQANMEHSYNGDISIILICPNGQSAELRRNTHSGHAYLGIPMGGDNHTNFDCTTTTACMSDPLQNPPGQGWTYTWTMNNPQFGDMELYQATGNTNPLPPGITNPTIDSGSYTPHQSFANLIGCPLNGTWNIQVCDYWGIDNGWVFWWKLNLNASILPVNWGYSVPIDTIIWTGPFITSLSNEKMTIHPDTGGVFDYHVYITDVFGCTYDTVVPITVVTTPVVDLGPDTSQCEGTPITLTAPFYPSTGYYWLPNGDTTQSIIANTTNNYVAILQSGNGNVVCLGQDTIHVEFFARPLINFMPDTMEGCEPVVVHFANGSLPLDALFSWDFGDGNFSTLYSPDHTYTGQGEYSVSLTATTGEGCQETYTVPNIIKVYTQPKADFTTDFDLVTIQNPVINFTNTSSSGDNPLWKFGDGDTSTLDNPSHTYKNIGIYEVWLVYQSEHGCIDSLMKNITVIDDSITVPNVITPNNDGINDYFEVKNIESFLTNEFIVYDRWGKKVYEKLNYRNDWNGGNLSDGTYYIILRGHGIIKDVEYKGTLTIIGKD
jgi:gliding motility-associated-like protein